MAEKRERTKVRGRETPHLRAWRESRWINQTELAQRAGVSRATVARGEAGGLIGWPSIRKVAEALGITPAQLLDEVPGKQDRGAA
jgi:transcriptional regulator with XRE-family HTH domain